MGRNRTYLTDEERDQARRAANHRSYIKRRKQRFASDKKSVTKRQRSCARVASARAARVAAGLKDAGEEAYAELQANAAFLASLFQPWDPLEAVVVLRLAAKIVDDRRATKPEVNPATVAGLTGEEDSDE